MLCRSGLPVAHQQLPGTTAQQWSRARVPGTSFQHHITHHSVQCSMSVDIINPVMHTEQHCTCHVPCHVGYLKGGADAGPPRTPMGGEQLLQHRVGGCNLDAPFFPGETEVIGLVSVRSTWWLTGRHKPPAHRVLPALRLQSNIPYRALHPTPSTFIRLV